MFALGSLISNTARRAATGTIARNLSSETGSIASRIERAVKDALEKALTQKSTNPNAIQLTTEQTQKRARELMEKKVDQLAKDYAKNTQKK